MKLKYNFVINQVTDKMVAVAVGGDLEAFNGFIKMNDIGAEIFEILKEDVTSFDVFDFLIRRKLMVRDCASFKCLDGEFIRFCIMNPEDNERLLNGLREFFNKKVPTS